ncbi:hypothetical protein J4G33_13555 [Actinotalea sp. BY-33]|uniref:Uncharacterized protein n=1 Tax=Actinotalea soli TaxID=2819234 RepID=A0A939LRM9_9CELL|nr:hypothetical protein [Actinotalea soli]MBO1752834.1 hypothetical protein [Actinotalea soli]
MTGPTPPPRPARMLADEVGRGLAETALELATWVLAAGVLVGVPALLGYLLVGWTGAVVGGAVGLVLLAVTWVALVLVASRSLVELLARRRR